MDKAGFWKLIDESRQKAEADDEAQLDVLGDLLYELEPAEIVEFDQIFSQYHDRAYDNGLWAAAYIIGGGCSDDSFMDFRGWLISRGETVYEAALADPETLVDVVGEDEETQVEGYQYVAAEVWSHTTGRDYDEFPVAEFERKHEPSGVVWEEEDLETLYPKLCERFF